MEWIEPAGDPVVHVPALAAAVREADAAAAVDAPPFNLPVKGGVYTITNIYNADDGMLMLEFAELFAPISKWAIAGYWATAFRPVIERKTSIEIFQRMLTPSELERV